MADEIKNGLTIPIECIGCTKKGMEAVHCLTQPTLDDEVFKLVQYAEVGTKKDRQTCSGGRYNPWKKKPSEGLHRASDARGK